MKPKFSILIKLCLIISVLIYMPIKEAMRSFFNKTKLQWIQYQWDDDFLHTHFNIKQQLCYYQASPMPSTPTIVKEKVKPQIQTKKNGRKIYIYSTHQEEGYQDQGTVVEGSKYLQSLLEAKGYEVLVEERSVQAYLDTNALTYNESYYASYAYLNDTLKKDSYDLIIDFHRDSIDRSLSVFEYQQKQYAKMMFVIGGSNQNYDQLLALASSLHQQIDQQAPGIMRSIMTRDIAYYNQYVNDAMVLIEVGSEANTFQEVKNSVEVLAEGIDEYFKERSS